METQDHGGSEMLNVHFLRRTAGLSGFQTNLAVSPAMLRGTGALQGTYLERQPWAGFPMDMCGL